MATITKAKPPSTSPIPSQTKAVISGSSKLSLLKKGSGRLPKSTKITIDPSEISLKTEKSEPSNNLGDYTLLLYGEKKIGKTSLCNEFPEAAFFFFELGGKGLRVYDHLCPNWDTFLVYVDLLEKTDKFQTVVIDTVDLAYLRCYEYMGRKDHWDHPNDNNDFGRTWQSIKTEFIVTMDRVLATGRGVIFVSHAEEAEFAERGGTTYKKIIPSMPKQVREYLRGFVDIIAYFGYEGEDRLLTIQGSDRVDAGNRVSEHFIANSNGEFVHSIPMGRNAREGYESFLSAFNNEQEDAVKPKRLVLSERPAPKLKRGR